MIYTQKTEVNAMLWGGDDEKAFESVMNSSNASYYPGAPELKVKKEEREGIFYLNIDFDYNGKQVQITVPPSYFVIYFPDKKFFSIKDKETFLKSWEEEKDK